MKWFNEARFGIFVHWGLYSILGRGEWTMLIERISPKEYAKLANQFEPPKNFKIENWVKLAKEAGAKYMVFTTRHHDGFCLYDSKFSDFTSVKTRAKRDFVAEYVQACRKAGLRVGLYYSLKDWRFPGRFNPKKYPESSNAMVGQAHNQVRELMTNYGKIDVLWYDGPWVYGIDDNKMIAKYWKSKKLNKMVRKLQPDIIINNRSGIREDIDTPEQHVTKSKEEDRSWESCMTLGDFYSGWGYVKNNLSLRTVRQLIQYLVVAACGGGNYLLNIGPKADGSVCKVETKYLKEIGRWMKTNGESIYNSDRISDDFWWMSAGMLGLATARGNCVYFHIFRWPGETAVIPYIKNKVKSARLLATGEKVKFEKKDNGLLILKGLPKNPPDKYDSVIKVECKGKFERISYKGIPL